MNFVISADQISELNRDGNPQNADVASGIMRALKSRSAVSVEPQAIELCWKSIGEGQSGLTIAEANLRVLFYADVDTEAKIKLAWAGFSGAAQANIALLVSCDDLIPDSLVEWLYFNSEKRLIKQTVLIGLHASMDVRKNYSSAEKMIDSAGLCPELSSDKNFCRWVGMIRKRISDHKFNEKWGGLDMNS